MARKRLLTILAGVTAAVTVTAAPAAAQIRLPGLGEITLGADECLEIGVDISLVDALRIDPSICISEDGVEIEGGAAGIDVGQITEPVEEVTRKVAEGAKAATDRSPEPSTPPSDTPSKPAAPAKGDGGGSAGSDRGNATQGTDRGGDGGASASDRSNGADVEASGSARAPQVSDPARDAQLGALRALRNDLAAGSPGYRATAGPVQTLGPLSSAGGDLAAPQVAEAGAGEVVPGVDERLAPEVTTSDDGQDAVLASSSPAADITEAPLALQLLAAALVLGAAAVWTIAARELGRSQDTTA